MKANTPSRTAQCVAMKYLLAYTILLCVLFSCENKPRAASTFTENKPSPMAKGQDPVQPITKNDKQSNTGFDFAPPPDLASLKPITLYATQYYIFKAKNGGTIPVLDSNEQPLGYKLDTCDWCLAAIEGTMYIKDGQGKNVVLNFESRSREMQVDCKRCKQLANYPNPSIGKTLWAVSSGYGNGVSGYKLVPFRTIAVDKTKIPYGSVIYIPSVRGKSITLPNGETAAHDGYFFAGDAGGDIRNNHIDVFTGISSENPFPGVIESDPQITFAVYPITDKTIVDKLTAIHRANNK